MININSRVNDQIIFDLKLRNIYSQYSHKFYQSKQSHELVSFFNHDDSRNDSLVFSFIQHTGFYVISETVFNYPYPWMSEKTFKAIVNKRPFILMSSPYSLTCLKKLGFKTFDNWIDESYDLIEDPSTRMIAIIDLIKEISSLDIKKIQEIVQDMESVLTFNYKNITNLLVENFNQQLENL